MTDEQKKAALTAAKENIAAALKKSETQTGLKWWERLIWIVLAGLAGAACSFLTGCGQLTAWEELTPSQRQMLLAADEAFHRWSGEHATITVARGDK